MLRLRLIIQDRLLLTDHLPKKLLRLLKHLRRQRHQRLPRLTCNSWPLIQLLFIQGRPQLLNSNLRLRHPRLKDVQRQHIPNSMPLIQLLLILAQLLQLTLSPSMQLLVTAHLKKLKDTRPIISQGQRL